MNNTFRNVFKTTPVIASRKSQKLLKVKQNAAKGKCITCNISRCFSCQQIIANTTFESI